MLIFTNFMSRLEKKVIPKMEKRLAKDGFKKEEIVYIYDNAASHTGGFSGWWMRSLKGIKFTIPPYSPEYNPIERFFNTVDSKFYSEKRIKSLPGLTKFMKENLDKIPEEKYFNYFLCSFYDMIADLIQFQEPEKYGAPKDKIYEPPTLPEE